MPAVEQPVEQPDEKAPDDIYHQRPIWKDMQDMILHQTGERIARHSTQETTGPYEQQRFDHIFPLYD